MRELPSQAKGDRFRAYSRRSSCVRIAPLALNFFKLINFLVVTFLLNYSNSFAFYGVAARCTSKANDSYLIRKTR